MSKFLVFGCMGLLGFLMAVYVSMPEPTSIQFENHVPNPLYDQSIEHVQEKYSEGINIVLIFIIVVTLVVTLTIIRMIMV